MSLEVLNQFGERLWCIRHESFVTLAANIASGKEAKVGRVPRVKGGVAVIPIEGPLTPKGGYYSTSTQSIGRVIDAALASDRIGGIVLDVDSPGGTVSGTKELADKIYSARGVKPIVAVASPWMASAAYWVGSAAEQVIVSPSGEVGSVGVLMLHVDYSQAMEQDGVKATFITAGKYKVEANSYEPLSEEAKTQLQAEVDETYVDFTGDLARNFGISRSAVVEKFGEGRLMSAKSAEAAGMVHGIDTLENVISRMAGSGSTGSKRADADQSRILAAAFGVADESPQVTAEQLQLQKKRKKRVQMLTSRTN